MNAKMLLELLEKIEYDKLLKNSFFKRKDITRSYTNPNAIDRMNGYMDKLLNNNPRGDFQWIKNIQDPERKIHLIDHIYELFNNNESYMTQGIKEYIPQLKMPLNEIIDEVNARDFRLGNIEDIVNHDTDSIVNNFITNNRGKQEINNLSDDDLVRAIMDEELNNWSKIR